jgi:hypothetical protein
LPGHEQQVVGQDSHEQPSLVRGESVPARLVPPERVFPLLGPVFDVTATVAYLEHLPGGYLGPLISIRDQPGDMPLLVLGPAQKPVLPALVHDCYLFESVLARGEQAMVSN